MPEQPKDKFMEMIYESGRLSGLDELSARIISILYVEPDEISLEELAERTSYSPSAVSTTMKMMVETGRIKRLKKTGTRKAYFYMEKDRITQYVRMLKNRYEKIVLPAKNGMPGIIEEYHKSDAPQEELDIAENYYKQVIALEEVFKKSIELMEDASKRCQYERKQQ